MSIEFWNHDKHGFNQRHYDLTVAAIHETAHAVVCGVLGGYGHVLLEPRECDPAVEKEVRAQFGYPQSFNDPEKLALVGLAGSLAESIHSEGEVDAEDWWDMESDEPSLSASDAHIAGEFTEAHVEQTLAILTEHWDEVTEQALQRMVEFNERYPEFLT